MIKTVEDDLPDVRAAVVALDPSLGPVFDQLHKEAALAMLQERERQPPAPRVRLAGRHEAWDYVEVESGGIWWIWGQRAGGTIGTRGWELHDARSVLNGQSRTDTQGQPRRLSLLLAKRAVEAAEEQGPPPGPPRPANPFTSREVGRQRGAAAFAEGLKAVPYHDPHLREAYTKGPAPTNDYVEGWASGWHDANLAAAVPESDDDTPAEYEPRFLKAIRDKARKEAAEVFVRRVETAPDAVELEAALDGLDELIAEEVDSAVYVLQLDDPRLDDKRQLWQAIRTTILAESGGLYNERAAVLDARPIAVPVDYAGLEEVGQKAIFGAYGPSTTRLRPSVVVDSGDRDADYRAVFEAARGGEARARAVGRELDVPDDIVEEAIQAHLDEQAQRAEAEIDADTFRRAPPASAAWEMRVRGWLEETLQDVFFGVDEGRRVYVKTANGLRYQLLWSLRHRESSSGVWFHGGLRRGAEEHHVYGYVEAQENLEAVLRRLSNKVPVDVPKEGARPPAAPTPPASDPRTRNALRWIGLGNRPTVAMTDKVRGRSLLDELIGSGYVERDGVGYVLTERGERETAPSGHHPALGVRKHAAARRSSGADWSAPVRSDIASSEVETTYLPSDDGSGDALAIRWFAADDALRPNPSERFPFFAREPVGKDFATLGEAQKAVERYFRSRKTERW